MASSKHAAADASAAADALNDLSLLASSDAHSTVEIHLRAGMLTPSFSIQHIKKRKLSHNRLHSMFVNLSFSIDLSSFNDAVEQTGW